MKFFALLCIVGLAAASSYGSGSSSGSGFGSGFGSGSGSGSGSWSSSSLFQSGNEYVFEYTGRMLTGIPELASHYSGLGLKCKIVLQSLSSTKFALKVRDARYAKVNDLLNSGVSGSPSEINWRKIELPSFSSVPSESQEYLEKTTLFEINESTGSVESVTVSGQEPEWTVNFKKALVVLFQTKKSESYSVLESNTIGGSSSPVTEGSGRYWETTEESIDGRCNVAYQINEIPKYMTKDLPEMLSRSRSESESCTEGKTFELIKTKDVSSCSTRSSFTRYTPGFFKCSTGNCEGMWSRSSSTRYIVCGSLESPRIQTIINEGELNQDLMGMKTEKFLTGVRQILKLVSKTSISSRHSEPSEPITLKSLMYEYTLKGNLVTSGSGSYSSSVLENSGLMREISEEELHKVLPRGILTTGGSSGVNVDEKLIPEVKRLLKEIVTEDLVHTDSLPKKQISMKSLGLSRAFAVMSKSGIKSVYSELKSEFSGERLTVFKNIFFDCLLMGGSVTDVLLVKEYILNGEITHTSQIAALLTWMPSYVVAPTQTLLHEIFELATSTKIEEHSLLYSHAVMGYTTLLNKACVEPNRKTSFPTSVFGTFCNPDSSILTEKWIPYLTSKLSSSSSVERKNLIVVSLGLIKSKHVLRALQPIIETPISSKTGLGSGRSGEVSGLTRFLAIYSLGRTGSMYPEIVVPTLMTVYLNQAEPTDIRVAAFNSILGCRPSTTVLQQISTSTWHETDMEVLKVVNTAFYSLKVQNEVEVVSTTTNTLSRKAALLYPLMKKTSGRFPTSATIISSDYLNKLGIGYTGYFNWISSKDSFLPSTLYKKLVYNMNRFELTVLEGGFKLEGLNNLVQIVSEISKTGKLSESEKTFEEEVKEKLSGEFKEIIEKLKIETRRGSQSSQGSIFLSAFENAKTFYNFDGMTSEILREKIMPYIRNPSLLKEKLGGDNEVNYQRMINLMHGQYLIPSDMGFPIIIENNMPTTFSVSGKFNTESNSVIPSFNMNVKTLFAAQYTAWVGTLCPFTKESLLTGIDEHTVINVPAEISVSLNVPEHKLRVSVKPVRSSSSGEVDLFHLHILPYTVAQKYHDLRPTTLNPTTKFIRSQTPKTVKDYTYGEYFGLKIKSIVSTESRFVDMRSIIEKFSMFNGNPLNMIRFAWANVALSEKNQPSLRMHEYKLVFYPTESTTKKIEFSCRLGVATKKVGEPIKYHKVIVENESEKVLPYGIVSKSLGEVSEHSERQNKIVKVLETLGGSSSIETGAGISIFVTMTIEGSRPRSYTYSMTGVSGNSEYRQKWNVHLESEHSSKKICVNGEVTTPSIPTLKIEEVRSTPVNYKYKNTIGFGHSCQESVIVVSGSAKTSESQKDYSKKSPEAKELQKMMEKNVPLAELSEVANKVREQASTLNEITFTTEYKNCPEYVFRTNNYIVEMTKAYLWPYINKVEGSGTWSGPSGTSSIRFLFHPSVETFDMTISRPNENVQFENIRMPYPLVYVMPKVAGKPTYKTLIQSLVGRSAYPTCKLEGAFLQTFKNRTTKVSMDKCYHVLAQDCGKSKSFSILARDMTASHVAKEIKVLFGGVPTTVTLRPASGSSSYGSEVRVEVHNGSTGSKRSGQYVSILSNHGSEIAQYRTERDGTIVLKNSEFTIVFDGEKCEVEASYTKKGEMCGLCGDFSNDKASDLRGPKKCVYSKPELLVASYRLSGFSGKSCSPLPSNVESELVKETEECSKYHTISTKLSKSYEESVRSSGSCTYHKNLILEHGRQICFSRRPITSCSSSCKPESLVTKKVSFTCLNKESRVAQHIRTRIEDGQIVSELENMSESFPVTKELPSSCRPY